MIAKLRAIALCNCGGSAAEYALILGLICTAIVVGGSALGVAVAAPFSTVATAMTP